MKRKCILALAVSIIICLSSCNNATTSNPSTDSEQTDIERDICYVCGIERDNGYSIEIDSTNIDLCKPCRDELMIKNSFLMVDGKKVYPFDNYRLYMDDLICFSIPDDLFEETTEGLPDFWKTSFTCTEYPDISILVGWEDFFSDVDIIPSIEDRTTFSFIGNNDEITDEDIKIEQLFAPDDKDYSFIKIPLQSYLWYVFIYDDIFDCRTIQNGVYYQILYMNVDSPIPEDDNYYAMDALLIASSIVFPTTETVLSYFS